MNENKANYAKIGFFVLTGFALILLVIGIAGARVFNRKVMLAETYFTESVTGLDLGSPVKYRGVPVGEIKRIGFVYSEYGHVEEAQPLSECARQILVVMALDPEKFGLLGDDKAGTMIDELVRQGLRVKIALSGVTGLSFLELDYFKADTTLLEIKPPVWKPNNPYIPSTYSTMTTLKKAVDDVFVKLSSVDIRALGDELLATLYLFQDKLSNADVAALSAEATFLLSELRETNQSVRRLIDAPELAQVPSDLSATVASSRRTAEAFEEQLKPMIESLQALTRRATDLVEVFNSAVTGNRETVEHMLTSLNQTALTVNRTTLAQQGSLAEMIQSLRNTLTGLERTVNELGANPSVLLFGQPPEPLPETRNP